MERGWQGRIDLGQIYAYARKGKRRRDGRRGLRSVPPLSARHRTGQTPESEELPVFHLLAADSTYGDRRPEHEGAGLLQPLRRCACSLPESAHGARCITGIFLKRWKIGAAGRIGTWPAISPTMPAFSPSISGIASRSGHPSTCLGQSRSWVTRRVRFPLPHKLQRFSESGAHPGAGAGRSAPRGESRLGARQRWGARTRWLLPIPRPTPTMTAPPLLDITP